MYLKCFIIILLKPFEFTFLKANGFFSNLNSANHNSSKKRSQSSAEGLPVKGKPTLGGDL